MPVWAAKALADIMYEAAIGKFDYGMKRSRIFARKKRATMYKKAREMIAAYNRVIELNRENRKDNPIGNRLYEQVGESSFSISGVYWLLCYRYVASSCSVPTRH